MSETPHDNALQNVKKADIWGAACLRWQKIYGSSYISSDDILLHDVSMSTSLPM